MLSVTETIAKVCMRVRGTTVMTADFNWSRVSLGTSIILTHPQTTPRWLLFISLFWFYE